MQMLAVECSCRGGIYEKMPGAVQCRTQPVPPGSNFVQQLGEKSEKKKKKKLETALQKGRSVEKEGGEVLQALDQRFSCSSWRRAWWSKLSPCYTWRTILEQISTLQLVEETMLKQVDVP